MKLRVVAVVALVGLVQAQKDPNFAEGRGTIVHLFEWKWSDIAEECEAFLGPNGFGGVQIAPPSENVIAINNNERPWWEIYQPISYKLVTRHGDEAALKDMMERCNKAGVRIYPDVVLNHMGSFSKEGVDGSTCDPAAKEYPAVPYHKDSFHEDCSMDYNSPTAIRNCKLEGMPDIDQSVDSVRQSIREFLNHLIELGAAGFRIDAAKHMWPTDLEAIFSSLNDLNADYFPAGSRAFVYQEVIDWGNDVVSKKEYTDVGRVCDFKYGNDMGPCFKGECPFSLMNTFGFDEAQWGIVSGDSGLVFITNHDMERDNNQFLNYRNGKIYRGAVALMLAHHYAGVPKIMSGYEFEDRAQGPPHDQNDNILSPEFGATGCSNGWNCEHRWTSVAGMVGFKNAVSGTGMDKYWTNGDRQVAWSRGDKGFFAVSAAGNLNESIETTLADGAYCDVVTGGLVNGRCAGRTVTVSGGRARVTLSFDDDEIALAIHVKSKLN